jgi:hypothetical protein
VRNIPFLCQFELFVSFLKALSFRIVEGIETAGAGDSVFILFRFQIFIGERPSTTIAKLRLSIF